MRRRSAPSALSIVALCSSLLSFLVVTVALDLCQGGDKLTAARRDAHGSLTSQCKTFVSEDCSVSCRWASSCRDSPGWHQYAGGNRSFVAGVRANAQYGLLIRCCISLASTITNCQWTSRSTIDQLARLPTTVLGVNPTTETVIRDILINPNFPPVTIELRAEVCAVVRERSTCDIARMVDEEMHDFRLVLLRSSRSKLLHKTQYDAQNQIRLMQKLFGSASDIKRPLRIEPNPYGNVVAPKIRPVNTINDLADDNKKTSGKPSFPAPKIRPVQSIYDLADDNEKTSGKPTFPPRILRPRIIRPNQRPELNDRQSPFDRKTTRKSVLQSLATTPRSSVDKSQCPRQPGWQPCVGKSEANSRLQVCCSKLTTGCQELCNYDINKDKLIGAALSGQCPVEELGGLIKCAAMEKDHTACCSALGVFEEEADLCKPLCNPRAGLSTVDFTFLPCLDHLNVIARCFWASVQPK